MNNLAFASAILPRAAFRSALAIVKPAVERRNTIPVLSTALIRASAAGGVEVIGTDLDVTITARMPDASADAAFATALPFHTLADLEKKARASGEMSIDSAVLPARPADTEQKDWTPEFQAARNAAEKEPARLDFQGLSVTLSPLPVDDFPHLAFGYVTAEFDMTSRDLLAMIEHVEGCISDEETRYYLNGIYLHAPETTGTLRAVATDGHKLGKMDIPAPDGAHGMPGIIIPAKTVGVLKGLCKAKGGAPVVRVTVNTTKILFTFGNVTVLSKLIDGTFPDYSRVIPSGNEHRATFDRAELAEAVKSVSAISSERGRAIRLGVSEDGRASVVVRNPDAGEARMNVACDMPEPFALEIGFNGRYVLDILATLEGDRVTFHLADAGSPTLIRDERGAEAEFVLMPMRV